MVVFPPSNPRQQIFKELLWPLEKIKKSLSHEDLELYLSLTVQL